MSRQQHLLKLEVVDRVQGVPLPLNGGHVAELEHVPGAVWLQQPCLHGPYPAHESMTCFNSSQKLTPDRIEKKTANGVNLSDTKQPFLSGFPHMLRIFGFD